MICCHLEPFVGFLTYQANLILGVLMQVFFDTRAVPVHCTQQLATAAVSGGLHDLLSFGTLWWFPHLPSELDSGMGYEFETILALIHISWFMYVI